MAFKHIETNPMEDIQSQGHLYQHIQTGAKVLFIENEDTNRSFTIAFKTPPYSNNGITHILEHSVLNGSKKFPTKEPFVELLKGSLSTYVNAMTYPDKTIYPIASTNQQDYLNLMEVYLDAVFHPLMLENPQILSQEGWHYHLEQADQDLIYKGVVFNEMKGATASPDYQIFHMMSKYLYPESHYYWESGGDPIAIPNLTQAEFVDYHQTYYHPSNSLTVLYGAIDQEATFQRLDEYFDQFEASNNKVDLSISIKKPEQKRFEETYSLASDDTAENKDHLALAWHVANPSETLDGFGLSVLSEILFGNSQAPLRKAILDAGFAGDVDGGFDEVGYPRMFSVEAKYTDKSRMEDFIAVVDKTLTHLSENGIAPDLIKAAINKITFQLKELVISESSPRGIIYATEIFDNWLYGENPFASLEFTKYLSKIEKLSHQSYFEKLIAEKLLKNPYRVELILSADPGKNDRLEKEKIAQLQEYKESLSEEECQVLIDKTQALIERQESPDRPEDLAKIPVLKREDLVIEDEDLPFKVEAMGEHQAFYHATQFTSGIDYVKWFLTIEDFEMADYPWLKLLASLLNKMPTENYSASDLRTQLDIYTGGVKANISIYQDKELKIKPHFVLSGKALESNLATLTDLMFEILTTSQIDDMTEILQIVQKSLSNFDHEINFSAHIMAANRAASQLSAAMKLSEQVSGIDYYHFLKQVRQQLQAGQEQDVIKQLQRVHKRLLNATRLSILYIGAEERGSIVQKEVLGRFEPLPASPIGDKVDYLPGERQHEAFVTAQDVNYVAQASFGYDQMTYAGVDEVASTMIRFDYLWNNIRVKGGAYGSTYQVKADSSFNLASYRDPNIAETLNTYEGIPNYFAQLEMSQESFDKNIIGTMNRFEKPLSAHAKGMKIFGKYMTGRSQAEERQLKEEILNCRLEDIQARAKIYQAVFQDKAIVVIGNKARIDQEADRFDQIYDLF